MNTKINRYSKFEKKSFPFCYLLIAFPVLQFCVFWIGINASSIGLAFQDGDGAFTFENIKMALQAFGDVDKYGNDIGKSLERSMILWMMSQLVVFPISVITTYILYRRVFGHYVFRVCYIIPGLMGTIMWVSLVQFMMAETGPIVALLERMNVELPELAATQGLLGDPETAFPSLLVLNFVMGLVGNNAVLTGAFSRIPEELYESADLDGAGFWTVCFKIAIPCVWSTIVMLLTFSLCSIFTADCNVWLYSGGDGEPGMSTIGFVLYNITYSISMSGGAGTSVYGYPAALGLVLTVMTIPVVFLGRWGLNKMQDNVEV